ncbi:hypothetical protein BI347_20480 [Chromobacterium sphagni]|uniref:Uncharacterized protein n=1 Tax=Chromobacterium sphagni TaxID=1903179 RepID=A0A1S1WSP4_9NEIS|nr:hypothetical protein [Chromobacterium sphagni]OHX10188.1 hypothetical protein BI347_20480 [Chromobacterium sphagni]
MTWHIEDDVGVVLKGTEASCIGKMQQLRRQSMEGLPVHTRGAVRVVNGNGIIVATLLPHFPQRSAMPDMGKQSTLSSDKIEHLGPTSR